MHFQFDNIGTENQYYDARETRVSENKKKGPGYGSVDYPLSERVQSAITEWGIVDAAKYYAQHGIKVREFLILAGPLVRSSVRA